MIEKISVKNYLISIKNFKLSTFFIVELTNSRWEGSFFPSIDCLIFEFFSFQTQRSSLHTVQILDVQTSSSGQYRCEVVGEAPTFTTHMLGARLTIVGE